MGKIPTFHEALEREQQCGAQHNQQRTLIRQLRRKFAHVPDNVVQKIEATDDIERLDNWLDQIIAANTLAETEMVITAKT